MIEFLPHDPRRRHCNSRGMRDHAKCGSGIPGALPPRADEGVRVRAPSAILPLMTQPPRSGVSLQTVTTVPGWCSAEKKCTAIIDRSPYGMFATELVSEIFLPFGQFVAVEQDFRGTGGSGGTFGLWRSSYNDTSDTIDWIVKQSWSDGQVYSVGGSADGIASLVLAAHPPIPALKKQVQYQPLLRSAPPRRLCRTSQFAIWATADPINSVYPGGAYRQALIDGWLKGNIKGGAAFEPVVWSHEAPGDPWWKAVTADYSNVEHPAVFWAVTSPRPSAILSPPSPSQPANHHHPTSPHNPLTTRPPLFQGWYDIFLNGNLATWAGYQYHSAAQGQSWLVVDALGHCQGAEKQFPGEGIIAGRDAIAVLLGLDYFTGKLGTATSPEGVKQVTFFVMTANYTRHNGNFWTSLDAFPEPRMTAWYLSPGGELADVPPVASSNLTYSYDPRDPVPTIGGNNLEIHCGPSDQSSLEQRSDVLIFSTSPLSAPLAVVGNLSAVLDVSSTAVDTDFTVKVEPDAPCPPSGTGADLPSLSGHRRVSRWHEPPHSRRHHPHALA